MTPQADTMATTTDPEGSNRISLNLPHNLLVLPPCAAFVGLAIGMSRGGSRARLRFLAENAHRPPTTIQGWYFYTKTRNYRVFYAACKTGARYALGLGGAVGAYVLLDESVGWTREQLQGMAHDGTRVRSRSRSRGRSTNRGSEGMQEDQEVAGAGESVGEGVNGNVTRLDRWRGWRHGQVHWGDGAIAGMIMGAGVGFIYSLPKSLFVRSLLLGSLLGGATSALQVVQTKVGQLRDEQMREAGKDEEDSSTVTATASTSTSTSTTSTSTSTSAPTQNWPTTSDPVRSESGLVQATTLDRPIQPSDSTMSSTAQVSPEPESNRSTWSSWIPGWGR